MATEEMLDIGEMDLECLGTVGIYAKKYFALRKKCEQIQQSNEKLVNRLYHVKRMIKKYRKEKRLLVGKLEEHGDNFREAEVAPLWEEPPSASAPAAPAGEDPSPDTKPPLSVETTAPTPTTGATPLDSLGSISPGGTTKVKKSRVDKDVNAPKKPANAFLKFCQQRRFSIQEQYRKEENEEISHAELTRRLASEWNALPAEKKNVYYDLYEQEKEKYEQELEAYTGGKQATAAPTAGGSGAKGSSDTTTHAPTHAPVHAPTHAPAQPVLTAVKTEGV